MVNSFTYKVKDSDGVISTWDIDEMCHLSKKPIKEKSAMKKTIVRMTYANGSVIKVDPNSSVYVPCLFFVEAEKVDDGMKYSFSGKVNPFPFKEIIVTKFSLYSLDKWLASHGWDKIAQETIVK